jgi:hypothetical protein
LPRARAQRQHAQRRPVRQVRTATHHALHAAPPHPHHADEAGVGFGKRLALEVHVRAGRKPGEIQQQVRALTRRKREDLLAEWRFKEPAVPANHGPLHIAAPGQLVDARVRPVHEAHPVPRGVHLGGRLRLAVHEHAVAEKAVHHLHHAAAVKDELIARVELTVLDEAQQFVLA